MTFTKTSQKFGQWIDFKLNVVYGLGFSNDTELNKFVDKFKEVKELTRSTSSVSRLNQTSSSISHHERSNSVEIASINRPVQVESHNESIEAQLKYENDRLKLALAQSSANARKWEEELQLLKNSNARLTTALQESHTNVEEWKKQLQFYKEECNRLRTIKQDQQYNTDDNASNTSSSNFKNEFNRLNDQLEKKLQEINDIKEQMRRLVLN